MNKRWPDDKIGIPIKITQLAPLIVDTRYNIPHAVRRGRI